MPRGASASTSFAAISRMARSTSRRRSGWRSRSSVLHAFYTLSEPGFESVHTAPNEPQRYGFFDRSSAGAVVGGAVVVPFVRGRERPGVFGGGATSDVAAFGSDDGSAGGGGTTSVTEALGCAGVSTCD